MLPKKAVVLNDSDDDDVIKTTPERFKKKIKTAKQIILSSDSEDDRAARHLGKRPKKLSPTKAPKEKLNLTSVDAYFGNKPVQMSKVVTAPQKDDVPRDTKLKKKRTRNQESAIHGDKNFDKTLKNLDNSKSKKIKNPEIGVHNDVDFDKTLQELDDDDLINNMDILDKTIDEASHQNVKDVQEFQQGSKEDSLNQWEIPDEGRIQYHDKANMSKSSKKRQRNDSDGKQYIFF